MYIAAGPVFVSRAVADDLDKCAAVAGEEAIAACTRAISSGRLHDHDLAAEYYNRGIKYGSKGITTAPSPTTQRRSGSIPNTPTLLVIAPTLIGTNATSTALSLITTRLCGLDPAQMTTTIGATLITSRKITTMPSPTTQRRSGSIPRSPVPTTIADLQNELKAIPPTPLPTSPRRCY